MNKYVLIIILFLGVITFIISDSFDDAAKTEFSDTSNKAIDSSNKEVSDSDIIKTENTTAKPVVKNQPTRGQIIDLSSKGLTKVPDYVFKEVKTEVLNISNNKLTGALQAEVRQLENLKVLDLSNNSFTGVPAEIGQLKNLEVLNLSGNPITGLPNELADLKNLKSLDLRETNYSVQDLEIIKKGLLKDVIIYLK